MRVLALISGGKDSMLALHEVAEEHEIAGLLGIVPEKADSYMFHSVNLHLLDAIADCLEIPITKVKVSGVEEVEVRELAEQIKGIDADALCIGGIESNYQKRRFERICEKIGMKLVAPLWKREVEKIMKKVVKEFETIIVSVSAMGLDESFLGRKIDEECFNALKKVHEKYKIHLAGEGGEYETLVLDAPLYKKRIKILRGKKVWDGVRGYYLVEDFSKISKSLMRKI